MRHINLALDCSISYKNVLISNSLSLLSSYFKDHPVPFSSFFQSWTRGKFFSLFFSFGFHCVEVFLGGFAAILLNELNQLTLMLKATYTTFNFLFRSYSISRNFSWTSLTKSTFISMSNLIKLSHSMNFHFTFLS